MFEQRLKGLFYRITKNTFRAHGSLQAALCLVFTVGGEGRGSCLIIRGALV